MFTTSDAGRFVRGFAGGSPVLVVLSYLLVYVFLDWASYVFPTLPLGITPWNPPPGLSLFLLLRGGLRYWPALFAAVLLADVVVRGAPAQPPALIAAAAFIAAGYTLAAWILLRRLKIRVGLDTARDLGMFLVVIVPATLLVASGFVGMHAWAGAVPRERFAADVIRYWVGDLNGILVLAPALLCHAQRASWQGPFSRRTLLEWVLQGLSLAAALLTVFAVAAKYEFRFFSLLFLPLIWIGARWGLQGATLALAAIQLGLIVMVQIGGYHAGTFVQLQFSMLALCVTGLVLGAVVTQRKHVEASLRDKQAALNRALQLAAAGEMSSGLAHELNQPLAALSNYLGACQLLVRAPQPEDRRPLLDETLDKALAEARRASEIVHRLRDFFRTGSTRPESVSVVRIVQDAVNWIRPRTDPSGIRLSLRLDPELPEVFADPLQIETVLQNLLANAVDALVDGAAAARDIEVSAESGRNGVEISVQDSGAGIAPEVALRLFEPFNTSKADGMGLGLAISRSLVQANGGELSAEPGRGRGARFVLKLPSRPLPEA